MIVRKQTIRFSPDRTPMPKKVKIGYESDNMVERLVFVLPDIAESQTATMMMDGEYANMVTLERSGEDDRYFADMTAERVGAAGEIECYIVIDGENGEVWNSGVFYLATGEVPAVNEELSERYPDAIEQMRTEMATHRVEMAEQVQRAEDAADRADGAADGKEGGYYMPAVDGDMLKWTPSKENMPEVPAANVRGPQGSDGAPGQDGAPGRDGADGQDGKPGADGVSPRVSVEDIDGGHRVKFVDAEGMKTIDVLDGEKGADGAQGPAGNPGVYVGGDEPDGPDVRLWIDPEGEDYPAVSYQPQTLTEEQQMQARDNIGAASAEAVGKLYKDKADRSEIPEPYTLPTATAETLGGVKVGGFLKTWLDLSDGSLSMHTKPIDVLNYRSDFGTLYPDNITDIVKDFHRFGPICMFVYQFRVNTAITDQAYGFFVAELPYFSLSRVWLNNATAFYIDSKLNTDNTKGIRVNGTKLDAGAYIVSAIYFTTDEVN